ncbi:MucR family transcriptional regulator [Methylobacterium flocculans]|uniref:MucR family transcriptional regulator n=1 Tax=Methylobacterium flocculans TaxID=2984843 RepID=UPI0021F2E1BA|nr:MucR family transcriptional regulator [Methylobacterium sp. FF17]
MSENTETRTTDFLGPTGDIVAAYVSNNSIRPADLLDLIRTIHAALNGLASGSTQAPAEAQVEKPTAAQVRKSVHPDSIVSFLDGKTYKTLKRHLGVHGLDAQDYRQRFGLPADYPMVASAYAARRSELAKATGLGRTVNRGGDAQPRGKGRERAA